MLRKLSSSFRTINPTQLVLELIIVFLGVYLAFLLSSYRVESKISQDRDKVIELLELGIDRYHELFEQFVLGHQNRNQAFKESLERNEIPDFSLVTFPAPQYPIDAITFIVTDKSYDLFQVGLYVPLTAYLNAFERLMYIEEKLVQLSESYQPLPPESHPDYSHLRSAQLLDAKRYLRYLELRKNTCEELVSQSKELKSLIRD